MKRLVVKIRGKQVLRIAFGEPHNCLPHQFLLHVNVRAARRLAEEDWCSLIYC